MYAIIRTGGHQEKVVAGEQITVDRLRKEVGESVSFVPLLISKDDGTVVTDKAVLQDQAAVVGTVLQHIKADKVDVFQYRQKTGYRRHTGHRQPLTLVEISEIRLGSDVARPPEPQPEEPPPAEPEAAEPEAAAEETPKRARQPGRKKAATPSGKPKTPTKKAPAR